MKSVGIICEYNPFHNGHLYHLNEVKKQFKDYVVILIMSGNFTERGEVSIINKWDKTRLALEMGVDLVIELPFPFACQSADLFAKGSISLLKSLKSNFLVFGSESNDVDTLNKLADYQLTDNTYNLMVKSFLDKGISYPSATSKSLYELSKIDMNKPNDILGLTYIREIKQQKASIIPITIKRTNDYRDISLNSNIASATAIRNALKDKIDISSYVPNETLKYLNKFISLEDYYPYLKYKIISDIDNLDKYQTVDEGLKSRIKKYIFESTTLTEFIENLKTKRYTYHKLYRMCLHILCNFKKSEAKELKEIKYIRLLGFSKKGQEYLNEKKKDITLPIVTGFTRDADLMQKLEIRTTSIYSLLLDSDLTKLEYQKKPIN